MATRLTTQDASFYFLEASTTPMHLGSLAILEAPEGGLDYEDLLSHVERRLPLVPRYRQRVREVAFGLARPVWVDDRDFDITYHVRRSALPKPGSDEQLHDLVARLTSRPLDRTRPLWEMYLVEGLADNRIAIFTKSHSSLVDGANALEINQVILDPTLEPREVAEELWMPSREPREAELVLDAVAEMIARPSEGAATIRMVLGDLVGEATKAIGNVAAVVRTAATTAPSTPLNATISRNRRFATVTTDLDDYRTIRGKFGCTVNDAILAVLTGALRNWLLSRGEPVTAFSSVRALVPIAVYVTGEGAAEAVDPEVDPAERDTLRESAERRVFSWLIDLPVGEPNPVVRLSHIAHASEAHAKQSRTVNAQTLVRMSGTAPATLHAMGLRVASGLSQRMFNLVITNAPGPRTPLYLDNAKLLEMYPVSPLLRNQALSVGLTSYDGHVYYGLNGDRDAMSDVDVVAALLYEALEELLDASR
ncbi:wax ester/triacylglycerol synthase family O-acyltransferase [Rhodococcus spelaei]|uniref:Diacylglycerol O-acyltransferase n=1 Tax=Rhodococcus spelaei TaxID=2546320 RepID=A0A541B190_9NOCA|nr:wax ester/triacylglycerol synthase family O-acyltransferase [Rhodococcus spelaei]TQF66071.1 wax ester/triacylglycerol synthase family O-acyltransferase [Rhodococcus spelaei]